MSLRSELSSLGIGVVDTLGDFVGGLGTNFTANSNANLNMADRIAVENSLALSSFQAEEKRKQERDELIKTVTYVLLALVVISLFAFMGSKVYKMTK